MKLDFNNNYNNLVVGTVEGVEVSVHQELVRVKTAILVLKQAPTMNSIVPAPQCATVLMCASLPLQGPTVSVPLLAQSISVGVPMLVPEPDLPPGTRAPITVQW